MLNKLFILINLCVLCNGDDGPFFRYDYKYYKETNAWLKLHFGRMNWDAARVQCYYEGAILASPLDKQLQASIMKLMEDQKSCSNTMFSGVSSLISQGVYTSVEGVPIERMPIYWALNEPALPDGCLVFYTNGSMGSKSCKDHYPFICYKEYEKLEINECGTVDNEYQRYDNCTTNCYKYHSDSANWATAYKICVAEGAQLTTTDNIMDYVRLQYPQYNKNTVAVGFKPTSNKWWDVIHAGSYETCVSRKWDGSQTSTFCKDYHHFICEKTVDSLLPNDLEFLSNIRIGQ